MLAGQTILVTGATGAIGQAICKAVVADGARVVIHYGRNRAAAEALLDEVGGQGWCLPGDLATPEGAWSLWSAAVGVAGRIHGLVNNAGIRSEVAVDAPLAEWQSTWERELRVNFLSAVDLTRSAILHFRPQGGGRILNMASRAGQRGYASNAMAYGATKAAQIALARSWQAEGAKHGPRVVIAEPAAMPTAVRARFHPGEDRAKLADVRAEAARLLDMLN